MEADLSSQVNDVQNVVEFRTGRRCILRPMVVWRGACVARREKVAPEMVLNPVI